MNLYVGNLSHQVTQDDLKEVFSEYGKVSNISMPIDRETGKMRGFAFVTMGSEAEETAAIEALNGAEWMGREMKVNKARPKEDRSSGGGYRDNQRRNPRY